MNRMRKTLALTLMAVALVPLLSGCIFSPKQKGGVVTPPDPIPDNTTPQLAMQRFIKGYEQKNATVYQGIFTSDFTYEFSNTTDPTLVTQYSTGWFKTDEKESSNHLFQGYTPPGGTTLPAATSITITLATDIPSDDNTSPNPAAYKVLLTRVDGSITVPQAASPLTYEITNNLNEFHLIRGDIAGAAGNLDATQKADSTHWYIYRWIDLTGSAGPASAVRTASTSQQPVDQNETWGHVKASWR
jgi:hypothetical protein